MNTKILIIFGFLIATLFSSCKKQPITPGNYQTVQAPVDTSHWQNGYNNGGSTPTFTNTTTNNQLFGTNWVLTDVYFNYAHTTKNDTVHFISNTKYTVGSDTTKYRYSLYSTMGNSTIDIYQFNPINGLYLSANNFNANAFTSTPVGGTIFLNLKDNYNANATYVSTFKKI